jgi:superfamily II DNA or RNA helicase
MTINSDGESGSNQAASALSALRIAGAPNRRRCGLVRISELESAARLHERAAALAMIFDERQYQTDAIATTNQRVAEGHRPIVCAATGSGKTVIAARMAKEAFDANRRVLWMTGREEILRQTFKTFNEFLGVGKVGILMRDEGPWWMYPPVTVASWDTLKARWGKADIWKIPADVVLVDEAHLSLSEIMSQTIMPHYRDKGAKVIGFTATPARRSGRGLGSYFTRIIQVRSVQQLIDDGFLAPCEYWAGAHVDLEKVKVDSRTNDYKDRELARASMEGALDRRRHRQLASRRQGPAYDRLRGRHCARASRDRAIPGRRRECRSHSLEDAPSGSSSDLRRVSRRPDPSARERRDRDVRL